MEGEMLEHLSEKQLGSKIKSGNSSTIPISNTPAHAGLPPTRAGTDRRGQSQGLTVPRPDLRAGPEMLELYTSFITKRARDRWDARNV